MLRVAPCSEALGTRLCSEAPYAYVLDKTVKEEGEEQEPEPDRPGKQRRSRQDRETETRPPGAGGEREPPAQRASPAFD